MTLMVLGLMGLLPSALQAPVLEMFSRKGSAVVSNVPGPQSPLYVCGQRVSEMHFWVPQSGTIGLGVSILSYAGQVHFGLIADRQLVTDPGRIVGKFGPEFRKLLLAARAGAPTSGKGRAAARGRPGRRRPLTGAGQNRKSP